MAMIVKLSYALVLNSLLFSFYINTVESVPEDYCFSPLNKSDCGKPPTPVFTHYREGSRCEIEMWRGCPTANLFHNEYHCSHHCIGKLWSSEEGVNATGIPKTFEKQSLLEPKYRCDVAIDTSKCTKAKQLVYTYDIESRKCIEVTYYGCPTENKFRDQEDCEAMCLKTKDRWEHDVNNLDIAELNKLNEILNELNADNEPSDPAKEQLKNKANNKIKPHTISDEGEKTDSPEERTNKPDELHNKSEEATNKPEELNDKSEETTNNPETTSNGEANEATTEAHTTVASTTDTQTTTELPETSTLQQTKRSTKKIEEGDLVRRG